MKTLKNLLQYDASKFIFVAFAAFLYIFSKQSYIAMILLGMLFVYLFKNSKRLLIYSFVVIFILAIRMNDISSKDIELPVTGEIQEVTDNGFYLKADNNVLCYYDNPDELIPGMIVQVNGYNIDTKTYNIMNTFDYEQYLLSENITSVISVEDIEYLETSFNLYIIKYQIEQYINNLYQEETASFLKLFILGEKDDIYRQNQESVTNLGISHLFAISGMHVGLLVGILSFFLKKLYISKSQNQTIILIFLLGYNIMTGFKISIVRASLLILGIYLKTYHKVYVTKVDILSLIFIGFLLYYPYFLYNIGFQLSFLVASSVMMADDLFKEERKIKRMIRVTLLASMISLPITLSINHSFGLVFIFSNIFFILFVSYIFLPISLLVLFIARLSELYAIVIKVFYLFITFFESMNVLIEFNFSQMFYAIGFWIGLFLFLTSMKSPKRKLLSLLIMINVFVLSIIIPFKANHFVRFLDVSQGDAIHIYSHGCNLLIDTGDVDNYDTLISYFEAYNLHTLDYVVITHYHSDHYGELIDLSNNLTINNLYVNRDDEIVEGLNYQVVSDGVCFACGSAKFQILSTTTDLDNENNNSIVLYAEFKGDNYLFTGDIESETEAILASQYEMDIDILKIPHHGSNTSSTTEFLESIQAEIGVISVGENNSYDLPDQEILAKYLSHYYQLYRTDLNGTISFYYYGVFNIRIIEEFKKHNLSRYHLAYT